MLEMFLCSLFTIFPDYLFRRYIQGKRFGKEITIYSVWYELRWGITGCVILTVTLITLIFYFHPSTRSAVSFYRTVPILPEGVGRVDEVYVTSRDKVKAGQKIFKLDSTKQEATIEAANRKILEVDAQVEQAKVELAGSEGKIQEARSAYLQAQEELDTKLELQRRNAPSVAVREIERLQRLVEGRQGSLSSALASKQSIEVQISSLLPAEKASAQATLGEAQVELDKTIVYAGVNGTVEQFTLRKGDVVNPLMRPAGILVPSEAGRGRLVAGFGQIESQVMKIGMIAEVTCIAKPMAIIPMVVVQVQDVIAAGQVRPTDQLIDPLQAAPPGALLVFLEPLYKGGFDDIPPGSQCIANAYTSNHDVLEQKDLGTVRRVFLHAVDTLGLVHAMILRVQALLLPIQTLVLTGH
jgi:multidrug resistance efflux pump